MTSALWWENKDAGTHREKMATWKQAEIQDTDTASSLGMPRLAGKHQKLGRGKNKFFPRAARENMALMTLGLQILACGTLREWIPIVLSRPVCGKLAKAVLRN